MEVVERGRPADGYVFTSRDGVGPMGADTPLEVLQQVQRRAGLTVQVTNAKGKRVTRAKVTYHELRHTAATTMLTGGKAAAVVARQLGHGSSQVTTGVYEHLRHDGLLDDALDVFSRPDVAQRPEAEVEEGAKPLN